MEGSHAGAEARLRLGITLLNDRRLDEAAVALDGVEAAGADANECAGARWFLAMLRGNFEVAWCASDRIRAQGRPDPHRFWQGESIRGKRVMIRCLHGFGDAVQMLRLLPMVREQAAYVVVQTAPALAPLVRCLRGADAVISWAEEAEVQSPEPPWEVQVEVMELPYLLRLRVEQLPYVRRYLELPVEACRRALEHLRADEEMSGGRPFRVGVVWAAGGWNPTRSIPVTDLAELIPLAGEGRVAFWSLQGPGASGEARSLFEEGTLRDGSRATAGVVALAASIAAMDLVITVDTFAAHVAGALGVPVWVLLEERADWRWMHARLDSPWYPSVRLFRCGAGETWPELVRRVRQELAARLAG